MFGFCAKSEDHLFNHVLFKSTRTAKLTKRLCKHVDLGITAPMCQQFSEALEAVWRGDASKPKTTKTIFGGLTDWIFGVSE